MKGGIPLTTPCGCKDSENNTDTTAIGNNLAAQDAPVECPALVHETVCIQAEVAITPLVTVGDIESFCVGGPIIGSCPGTPSPTDSCTFTVSQNICVQVPLTFSADATAMPTGIICGTPAVGPC